MASIRWVRPILSTSWNSSAFGLSEACSFSIAGIRSSLTATPAAMCIAVGKVSLDDCPWLTWSLGWTGSFEPMGLPASWEMRLAITSLAFMLVEVPEPVW